MMQLVLLVPSPCEETLLALIVVETFQTAIPATLNIVIYKLSLSLHPQEVSTNDISQMQKILPIKTKMSYNYVPFHLFHNLQAVCALVFNNV